ncbi:HGL107Wp [Eremothecium sinecaudum]|uniref:Vacuolar protein sorting-associated protein 41 n=1 Tax=Eremothecium sinecaudum TaxID=45286 RepID=A0A109V0P7_9SACH|nr:HGL107Wp [Eremothecium sinecaudum]AMD22233.1 HGL107Wp [Eremothecium sinecaudum]
MNKEHKADGIASNTFVAGLDSDCSKNLNFKRANREGSDSITDEVSNKEADASISNDSGDNQSARIIVVNSNDNKGVANLGIEARSDECNDDGIKASKIVADPSSKTNGLVESLGEGTDVGSESDSDEEDETEEYTEEDEDDDEPPMLKYTRITQLPRNFFQRDSISACMFHDRIFAFATHSGLLHLTDPDFNTIRTFKCHRSSILSIHTDGEYFATASIDGTVVIGSIDDPSDIIAIDFKRPVHAVVLDHNYKSSKTFISGGMAGEVIVSQRNWMGSRVESRIDKGKGPILGIYTIDDIIFWMNDSGISFYSISGKMKLLNVPFSEDSSVRPDLYWPKVHFPEVNSIIVCWGRNIWTFKVSLTTGVDRQLKLGSILTSAASSLRTGPDKKVELESFLKLDCLVAGVASFKDDQLLVLGVNAFESKIEPPELKVINMLTGEELHSDEVVSKNFQNLTLNDYHLGKYIGTNTPDYFLISANDAILVKELTLMDSYNWYMENSFYYRAWELGKFIIDEFTRFNTGLRHVQQLIDDDIWQEAAEVLNKICGEISWNTNEDSDLKYAAIDAWQEIIEQFLKSGQVEVIAPSIPEFPRMKPAIYDNTLKQYLEKGDFTGFLYYIKTWPVELYSVHEFEELLEEKSQNSDEFAAEIFCRSLCHLYLEQKKFLPAVNHLIRLHDAQALEILITENILASFGDKLVDIILLPYDGKVEDLEKIPLDKLQEILGKSIQLLVQNRNSIPLHRISEVLSPSLKVVLFLYLKTLSSIEPLMVAPYETQLVELYSKYEPGELLNFLRKHSNYNIERAIEVCEREDSHYQELIYLWGKISETKKALSLIIDKLNDPALAISFVIDSNDTELWHFLVNYSMDKPNFIRSLLQYRDEFGEKTLEIMKKIPPTSEIDDEMIEILRNITKGNWLSKRVNLGVLKIIYDETKDVALEFLEVRSRGKVFNAGS